MLITLAPDADPQALADHLVRAGVAATFAPQGRAMVVKDLWVPQALRADIESWPGVASVEDLEVRPRRALGLEGQAPPPPQFGRLPVVAGPCAVEGPAMIEEAAAFVASLGGRWLRGGTDKPRTSPHGFQGHGLKAATWLRQAADAHGLSVIAEVTDSDKAEALGELADVIQVGTRNMHNGRLLQRLGRLGRPILLKRGFAATPDEWLWAAEYALEAGAPAVWFCERGLRSPAPLKRFTLDLGAVPFVQAMTPWPVLVDPSHAAGSSPYVAPLARAALAAGADALLIEVHPDPARACSDALQALDFDAFRTLAGELIRLRAALAPEAPAAC